MGDFFEGLSRHLNHSGTSWRSGELGGLLDSVLLLSPSEFAQVMPSVPAFIGGADKVLLLSAAAARLAGATEVTGTNASVSHGIAVEACNRG